MNALYRYRYFLILAGLILIGGSAGFFYYKFVGCRNSCAITSDPVRSVIWGALMGGIAGFPGLEKWFRVERKRE
jgi:hypothetical protein